MYGFKLFRFIEKITKKILKKSGTEVSNGKKQISHSNNSLGKRVPYFIQIGLDFGTSYSKCVYRDMKTNRVWVHIPERNNSQTLPFLDPSVVIYKDGILSCYNNTDQHYPENGLYHIKVALAKKALGQWSDPVIKSYSKLLGTVDKEQIDGFIECSAIYYLSCLLGEVKNTIYRRFPEFGSHYKDYIAVNMAIPVGEAEIPEVNDLFYKVLTKAWVLSDYFTGRPEINIRDLEALLKEKTEEGNQYVFEACYIYPEVSASVQGFVRSRVSGEGIYLFSDIGAGSVDQSVFVFRRPEDKETLTYLCGRVLPLGSGQIEYKTAEASGSTDFKHLEEYRIKKEKNDYTPEMLQACRYIEKELAKETERTLAIAKNKLRVKGEINKIRLIFGGGGFCENPYKRGILSPFSGNLFNEPVDPDIVHVPLPNDIEIDDSQKGWMNRLSVAYGLSFIKGELARFIYPKEIREPEPEEIWRPVKQSLEAPSKDQC